ncbi:hypothetical protein C6P44_000346 [Monosporozyma unispora]|nr:hypothetical protein C6P44_000346 [Kazachstania unispora]
MSENSNNVQDSLFPEYLSGKITCKPDAVHEPIDGGYPMAPGQLYPTEAGTLFHAGNILIALVGLPATSKTLLAVAMTRYTRWLGVRTRSFHVSEYRRHKSHKKISLNLEFEQEMVDEVINDMKDFFENKRGQIAIFDSLNILRSDRQNLVKLFGDINVKVLFIESILTDAELVNENIEIALRSNQYLNWRKEDAVDYYTKKLSITESQYEQITREEQCSYLKYINFGKQLIINHNNQFGYLINKIVFFLMNLRNKTSRVYLARCGRSNSDKYKDDELLNDEGIRYSKVLTDLVLKRVKLNRQGKELDSESLTIWAGPRKRTIDTGMFFLEEGFTLQERSQLKQLQPGNVVDLSFEEIQSKFPKEYVEYLKDPYHYRFSRAESYHDLAVRMEPLLLELEHMKRDVLIIAHESTLRILYGYLLACTSVDVPKLEFSRYVLTEITFGPFSNTVERIPIK